jgi:opacity protein-like surface antigen
MCRSLIVIAVLVIFALPALSPAASSRPGPYVSGFLGATVPRDTTATGTDFIGSPALAFNDLVEFDPGINLGGTVGYDFGMIRMEGELSYKQADINTVTERASGIQFGDVDGDLGALAMMFNTFVDLHNDTSVTPYLGGGFGFAAMYLSDTFGTDPTNGVRGPLYLSGSDTVFAYQAGAGLEIALNREVSLDLGYRYFGTSKARFGGNQDITTSLKFESHNAAVGVRLRF